MDLLTSLLPIRAELSHGQADGAVAAWVDLVAELVPGVGGSSAEVGIVVVCDRPPVVVIVVAELGLLPVVVHRPVVLGRETIVVVVLVPKVVVVLVPEVVVLVPEVVVLVPEVIVVLSPVGEIEIDVPQIFLCETERNRLVLQVKGYQNSNHSLKKLTTHKFKKA